MKYLFLLCLTVFFYLPTPQAAEMDRSEPLSVYDQVRRHVAFHTFSRKYNLEGTVHIRFYIDELHTIHLTSVSGTNRDLIGYVKQKLRTKEIYGQKIIVGKIYEMTFSYFSPRLIGQNQSRTQRSYGRW